ncbi:NADH-quinone oxidoreductase subunit NuoK [Candidatus Mycalebacterium sp.]
MTPDGYIALAFALFVIGAFGVLTRKNILVVLMSVEIMLNAANLCLIAFSRLFEDGAGNILVLVSITVAAAEVAVGLALVIVLYSGLKSLNIDLIRNFRG